jgi:hypothetical protein
VLPTGRGGDEAPGDRPLAAGAGQGETPLAGAALRRPRDDLERALRRHGRREQRAVAGGQRALGDEAPLDPAVAADAGQRRALRAVRAALAIDPDRQHEPRARLLVAGDGLDVAAGWIVAVPGAGARAGVVAEGVEAPGLVHEDAGARRPELGEGLEPAVALDAGDGGDGPAGGDVRRAVAVGEQAVEGALQRVPVERPHVDPAGAPPALRPAGVDRPQHGLAVGGADDDHVRAGEDVGDPLAGAGWDGRGSLDLPAGADLEQRRAVLALGQQGDVPGMGDPQARREPGQARRHAGQGRVGAGAPRQRQVQLGPDGEPHDRRDARAARRGAQGRRRLCPFGQRRLGTS